MTPRYYPSSDRRGASFPNLNYTEMRKVCSAKPSQLAKKYGLVEQKTPDGRAWFKDNGASVLAVAHLDSRQPFLHFDVARLKPDTLIYCPTLDDRLGAYIILEWLATAGIKVDILLTENEEKGQSTAGDFQFPKGKEYNWMFMFDRTGTDVVMYNYHNSLSAAALEKHGWKVGYGSYSCISDLEDLGVKGFNFGTGYHNYHSEYAYASRNEIMQNLRKFYNFFNEYAGVQMPHSMKTSYFARDRHQGHLPFNKYNQEEEYDATPILNKYAKVDKKANNYPHIYPINHGSEDQKSKVDLIKERIKAGKEKTETLIADAESARKKAIASLLIQDIQLAGFSEKTLDFLYNNSICLFAELVVMSRIELLNIRGATKEIADNIELELKKYGLGFNTMITDYNVDMTVIENTVENTIRKEIRNGYTGQVISTSQDLKPGLEDKAKDPGLIMLPLERKVLKKTKLALPLSTEASKPTEKSEEVEYNDAEIIMIGIERHKDDNYRLVSDNGKLVWREKVKVGFVA